MIKIKTYDFDGKEITIKLPKGIVPNRISEYFLTKPNEQKQKLKMCI